MGVILKYRLPPGGLRGIQKRDGGPAQSSRVHLSCHHGRPVDMAIRLGDSCETASSMITSGRKVFEEHEKILIA